VNTHLLDKIVERTRAASQFVMEDEDLEVKVSSFFTKIKEPLLTNLKISWPDAVRVTKLYPNPLPDLFRGDQLVLAGRYTGSGEGDVVIEGTLNGEPKHLTQHVKFPDTQWGNEFIPQLWAMRRVGMLLDEIRLRGENAELRDEVVELARRYAIVTPYTSYLIVEDEARRHVPVTMRSLQSLDKDRGAQLRLRESWEALPAEKAGSVGNSNARANQSLKYADSLGGAEETSKLETRRAVVTAKPTTAPEAARIEKQLDDVEQNTRVVRGKSFYQNGAQWIDADAQRAKNAKAVRVQFASDEYFTLLAKNADAAQWLALGRNVQFTLGDTLYEVFE
jgi:Ca-activated chloride channel family protein